MKKAALSVIALSLFASSGVVRAEHTINGVSADTYSVGQIFDLYKSKNVLYGKNEGYKYFEPYGSWYMEFAKSNKMDDALSLNLTTLWNRLDRIKSNGRYDFVMNGYTKTNHSPRLEKYLENTKKLDDAINEMMRVNNMFLFEDIDLDKAYSTLFFTKEKALSVIGYTNDSMNEYDDFSVGYMKELNVISTIIFEHSESIMDDTLNKIIRRGDVINPQPKYINQLNF